ncbi:hypothetical protein GEMRC1_006153 [Eukaryota sp. GEM-RC1]
MKTSDDNSLLLSLSTVIHHLFLTNQTLFSTRHWEIVWQLRINSQNGLLYFFGQLTSLGQYLSEHLNDLWRFIVENCSVSTEDDAETRSIAIKTLANVISLSKKSCEIFEIFKLCLTDYQTDNRGDVGSWVRISTLQSIFKIFNYFSESEKLDVIALVLEQCLSKNKRVRTAAALTLNELQNLKNSSCEIISNLATTFDSDSQCFATFFPLLTNDSVSISIWRGTVALIGEKTEYICRESFEEFKKFVNKLSKDQIREIFDKFLKMWSLECRSPRLSLCILKSCQVFIESGIVSPITENFDISQLFKLVRSEMSKSMDVSKLEVISTILSHLMSENEVSMPCLLTLVSLTGHPMPKVRGLAVDRLYQALILKDLLMEISDDFDDETGDTVSELLTSDDWMGKDFGKKRFQLLEVLKIAPKKKN